MNLNGLVTAGYAGDYGNEIPSSHGLNFGGSAQLSGSYYNPNFINFSVTPYYNQSRADSSFQSLTDATGVDATANFFTGSHFPGFASYNYTRNSTGTLGLTGSPNFTTIGNGQGFGVGWSALLPNLPTFSVAYSQGSGTGTLFGTNEVSSALTRTLNMRSSYQLAGWNLNAFYTHLNLHSDFPLFFGGDQGVDTSNYSSNNIGADGSHKLPWNGSLSVAFTHSSYSGEFGSTLSDTQGNSRFSTDSETANVSFHPTNRLTLFGTQSYTNDLNGYFYQSLVNSGGAIPVSPRIPNPTRPP